MEDNKSDVFPWKPLALVSCSLLALLTFAYLASWYWGGPSTTHTSLGTFGDFVGGLLNPMLGFITVGLLIWSIQVQLNEMSNTTEQLRLTKNVHKQSLLYPDTMAALEEAVSYIESTLQRPLSIRPYNEDENKEVVFHFQNQQGDQWLKEIHDILFTPVMPVVRRSVFKVLLLMSVKADLIVEIVGDLNKMGVRPYLYQSKVQKAFLLLSTANYWVMKGFDYEDPRLKESISRLRVFTGTLP